MPSVSGNVGAVFNGGTVTSAITINDPGAFGTVLDAKDTTGELKFYTGGELDVIGTDAAGGVGIISVYRDATPTKQATITDNGNFLAQDGSLQSILRPTGLASRLATTGALSTVSPSSGTAFQLSTQLDRYLVVPFTLTTAAGTCKVELSPDNSTFSTLVTLAPAVNAAVSSVNVLVPATWYVKLTITNATLGTGTYY